jgi:tripartite-type tricarboxylate transporter receptor subunit TctC
MKKSVNVVGRLTSVMGAVAAVAAVGLSMGSTAVMADPNWPNKPVTIIVPFPAGGGTDAFARPLTTMMNKLTSKQFILDYKGGAGGTLGAGIAAKAGDPRIKELSGNTLPSVTTEPAPTKQFLPITARLSTTAWIPINEFSPIVQPCNIA